MARAQRLRARFAPVNGGPLDDVSDPDLSDLFARSISKRELVVSAEDALAAIDRLERASVKVLGWEGWLRYHDGKRSHDLRAQGTSGLANLSVEEAAATCRETIIRAAEEWTRAPESDAIRFYCITY